MRMALPPRPTPIVIEGLLLSIAAGIDLIQHPELITLARIRPRRRAREFRTSVRVASSPRISADQESSYRIP